MEYLSYARDVILSPVSFWYARDAILSPLHFFTSSSSLEFRLRAALDDTDIHIVGQGQKEYNELIYRWSARAIKRAGAILLPTTEEEVSRCIRACRSINTPLVIAGGRHNAAGASSIEGGVVIDLRKMKEVTIDKAAQTVTAQGGCVWQDVDTAAAKHDLAIVGGTVSDTGVAGLTLGGGYGYLTSRHGLTLDNLLSVRLVTAQGYIITVSEKEYPDLFWAIRGSGSNFGAACSFTFQAYPKPQVFAGLIAYTPDKFPAIVKFMNDKHKEGFSEDMAMRFIFATAPFGTAIICDMIYFGTESEGRKYYEPILALQSVKTYVCGVIPYETVNSIVDGFAPPKGSRGGLGGASYKFPMDLEFYQSVLTQYANFVKGSGGIKATLIWEVSPLEKVLSVPDETMCYANRGDFYNVAISLSWQSSEQDEKAHEFTRDMGKLVLDHSAVSNDKHTGLYTNYCDEASSYVANLFGANLPRLLELKKKYDPDNVFRSWHKLKTKAVL